MIAPILVTSWLPPLDKVRSCMNAPRLYPGIARNRATFESTLRHPVFWCRRKQPEDVCACEAEKRASLMHAATSVCMPALASSRCARCDLNHRSMTFDVASMSQNLDRVAKFPIAPSRNGKVNSLGWTSCGTLGNTATLEWEPAPLAVR